MNVPNIDRRKNRGSEHARHAPQHAQENCAPPPAHAPQHAASERIYLCPPDVTSDEREALLDAFDSNWIAPVGPVLGELEKKLCEVAETDAAVATTSGTAALHLALLVLGVGPGDTVIVPSLALIETANVVRYIGARPILVDCEASSGNIDPHLLDIALRTLTDGKTSPAAVIASDLYGSCADYSRIEGICNRFEVPLVEYAAESIGASHNGRPAGSFGTLAAFSFNGNKLITSGGGGALVGPTQLIDRARRLAAQARESAPHLEYKEVGYAYRMSNLLAAVACSQLDRLAEMMGHTRKVNHRYAETFAPVPGISIHDIDRDGRGNGARAVVLLDQRRHCTPAQICAELAKSQIEARPAYKPMHLQTLYSGEPIIGGNASEEHFAGGICLPSGSSLTTHDQGRVIASFLAALSQPRDPRSGSIINLDSSIDVRTERPQQHLGSPAANRKAA